VLSILTEEVDGRQGSLEMRLLTRIEGGSVRRTWAIAGSTQYHDNEVLMPKCMTYYMLEVRVWQALLLLLRGESRV
jgi:hypothetical protein